MRPLLEYAVPVYAIPILWRTSRSWSLSKDLLQKCVQRPGKMWTMMNSSVCSTCQIWKLGGIPQNSASYINELLNGLDLCLTLLLTTDVTSHILQGLTVTPFKFHLLIPQAISTLSFVKPPGYGMNYQLRLSHLRLLACIGSLLWIIHTPPHYVFFFFFWLLFFSQVDVDPPQVNVLILRHSNDFFFRRLATFLWPQLKLADKLQYTGQAFPLLLLILIPFYCQTSRQFYCHTLLTILLPFHWWFYNHNNSEKVCS